MGGGGCLFSVWPKDACSFGGEALVRAWPLLKGYMVSAQLHTSSCEACDDNNHNKNI